MNKRSQLEILVQVHLQALLHNHKIVLVKLPEILATPTLETKVNSSLPQLPS